MTRFPWTSSTPKGILKFEVFVLRMPAGSLSTASFSVASASRDETTKIIGYFTAVAQLKNPFFSWDTKQDSTPELLKAGETLMSAQYFSCWSCHVRGSQTPEGPMEQWAPNLAYARDRLNPQWILTWIKDPNAIMPGTKMPSFYPGGPDDVFDGNEERQILAMRDFIMSIVLRNPAWPSLHRRLGRGGRVEQQRGRGADAARCKR